MQLNATSGNISPNPETGPEDIQGSCQAAKLKDKQECSALTLKSSTDSVACKMELEDNGEKEETKEDISEEDEEEEEEEDVDEEDEENKVAMQGGTSTADMSLEEARYTLQHIKNEASSDEDSKKILKPPYR